MQQIISACIWKLWKVNKQYIINVEIIDVVKRSTNISVSGNWNGERDSLDTVTENIVHKISGQQKNIDALNASNDFKNNQLEAKKVSTASTQRRL